MKQKKTKLEKVELSDEENICIANLSKILSIGRAKVKRDGHREITQIFSPESTHRIVIALSNLYKSLICVNEDRRRSMHLIKKVALDSIPVLRYQIISSIFKADTKTAKYERLRNRILGISDSKVRRTIEDMCLQRIIVEKSNGLKNTKYYSFTDEFSELMKIFD